MTFPTKFIKAQDEFSALEKSINAPLMRKNFTIDKDVTSSKILIAACGYYEIYINSNKITKGFLAPYRSNPDQIIYYDEYDLTKYIKKGNNTIGLILGNGIQNPMGAFVWEFDKARFRTAESVAFKITNVFSDDEKEEIISDESVKTFPSPIIFNDLHFGEYYDARLEIEGWNSENFDDSNWKNVKLARVPSGECRICEANPIKIQREIKCVSITKEGESFRYDFGENCAGLFRLKIKGERGQKVLLQFGEIVLNDKLFFGNIRFNPNDRFQEDEYYLSGLGVEEYTPHFTYHGFRYIKVTGITEAQATEDLLTYLVINSDIETVGKFSCSDEITNKLQEATVRSDLSNFYYFPTDCPQREKNGWTADAALSAEQMLMNFDCEKSYVEWMRNIYKCLDDRGALPGIVPTAGWGYHWGNGPAWDCVIAYLPYFTYKYRGNRQIIEESAPHLIRYLSYLTTRQDEKGLIAIGLGDWCPVDKLEDKFDTPLVVTDSIIAMDIAEKSEYIYDKLNLPLQKEFACNLKNNLRNAIRRNLIDNDLFVNGKTQTAQAMGIYYGLFDENEKKIAFDNLMKLIDKNNGFFDTGVLGGRVIFRVLAEFGELEKAYNMIIRPEYPSYGNWIVRGSTTLWENFHQDGGRLISLNHHFWGDISAWFYKYVSGIDINRNMTECNNIDIKPYFFEKLSFADGSYKNKFGSISSKWERKDENVILEIEVCGDIYGEIIIPNGYCFDDGATNKKLKSGIYKINKK